MDFAILVLSCDKYSDLWDPFIKHFRKCFPQTAYPIYFGSNELSFAAEGLVPVLSGPDTDWSTSLRAILRQIPEKKLFVILEDLFISTRIEQNDFDQYVSFMLDSDAKHIKHWKSIQTDRASQNTFFSEIARGAPYRATVAGFWDREYLLGLLIDGESPWNFEVMGSYRTSYSDGFYSATRPLCGFVNLVEKGCWIPESIAWADQNGIQLDIASRPLLVGRKSIMSHLMGGYFNLMFRIPWRVRLNIMNKLRKALISY